MMVSIAMVVLPVARSPIISFALAATDWYHGVDRHDTGLHGLIHAAPFDHARCNFFKGIKRLGFDRAFAVERLPERVHHAAQQRLAHGNGKKPTSRFGFVASHQTCCRPSELRRLQFLRGSTQAEYSVWNSIISEHDVTQTFDARDAIAGFTHNATLLFVVDVFNPSIFVFDFSSMLLMILP